MQALSTNSFSGLNQGSTSATQGSSGNLGTIFSGIGNSLGLGTSSLGGGSAFNAYPSQPISKSPTGGTIFPASQATGYVSPTPKPITPAQPAQLSSYIINNTPTQNGGQISTDGSGNPLGYSQPPSYSINTSGTVPSSALTNATSYGDVAGKQQTLQDYVNAVAQANGYSPDYIAAQTGLYGAQAQGAQLGVNAAQYGLNSADIANQYYNGGSNIPGGATTDYLQGITAKAQAQNTLQNAGNTLAQAQNTQQQTGANIALNAQQLARASNIAGAQAQLQYSPGAVNAQNAQAQYNALQQQYAGVNIPPFDPSQDPNAQLQDARFRISTSPAYQSGFQNTFTTPGGGTGIYNKLNTNGLTQNSDGTISLVSGAAAALGSAESTALNQNISTYNQIAPAYTAANNDFTAMTEFMQNAGINQSNLPIINQIQNAVNSKTLQPGAMAAFNGYITSLRTNYANLLGTRGETPTQAGADAASLIPPDLSPSQLLQVRDALNTAGGNVLNSTSQTINSILGGITSGTANSNTPITSGNTNSNVGNSWSNL